MRKLPASCYPVSPNSTVVWKSVEFALWRQLSFPHVGSHVALSQHLSMDADARAAKNTGVGVVRKGWAKGGNVTSAGWWVTLCDPIWHVSSRSGEACCKLLSSALIALHSDRTWVSGWRTSCPTLDWRLTSDHYCHYCHCG